MKINDFMSIRMRPIAGIFLLMAVLLGQPFTASAQIPDAKNNPTVMAQMNSMLSAKGLTQEEVKERLKTKGINIDALSEAEIIAKRPVIEQTVAELEAEKKNASAGNKTAPGTPAVVDPVGPSVVSSPSPGPTKDSVTTKTEAVADAVQKTVVQKAPEMGIYGHDIFPNQTLEAFRTTDGARAPDTYVLGAGDKVRITIFGPSQADLLLEINKEGYIQPTGLKQIYLQGISLGDARPLIFQRFSAGYRFQRDQFALTLQTARAITVNVFGEANLRGSFNMSALNTAFNALAVAGGPATRGSIRNIELIRGNDRKQMDVYAFLSDPAVQFQYDIQQNDILYVPMAQKVVSLEGAVKRPMKYELIGKEGLAELLNFAGGVNFNTYVEWVQIERAEADSVVLLEYKLADVLAGKLNVQLSDGDVVTIRSAAKPLEQFTDVNGAVFYPGRYELQSGMTLAQVLKKVQLSPEAYTKVYFIERSLRDGSVRLFKVKESEIASFKLEAKDKVQIFNKSLFTDFEVLEVVGAVRQPIKRNISYGDEISLVDALELAGGITPNTYPKAQLIRRSPFTLNKHDYLTIDLTNPGDFQLTAGDRLIAYDKRTFLLTSNVTLSGAVKTPLNLVYGSSLTLEDMIRMGGGFTRSAALNRVDVFRLEYSENGSGYTRYQLELDSNYRLPGSTPFTLMPYDQVIVRDLPMFRPDRSVQLSGEVKYPGNYLLGATRTQLSSVIEQAGGLNSLADKTYALLIRAEGNKGMIGVDLKKMRRRKGSKKFDPLLLPGDVITVSPYQNTMGIRLRGTRQGELLAYGVAMSVKSPNDVSNFTFRGNRNARWYIMHMAGGFDKNADRNKVTITYPDGSIKGTKKTFLFFRDYPTVKPGAVVSLAQKEEKKKDKDGKGADWDKLFTKIISAATAMALILTATK